MNWIEGLLFGIVSGLTAFLPVSLDAHQTLLRKLFGAQQTQPLWDLLVHAAILAALLYTCRGYIAQLRRDGRMHYRRGAAAKPRMLADYRLIRTATVPMLLGMLLFAFVLRDRLDLLTICWMLMINAVLLYIPERMLQGNKEAASMTAADSLLIGIAAGFCGIPGISCIGTVASVSTMRGANRQSALNWGLMLCIPALVLLMGYDALTLFRSGTGLTLSQIPGLLLSLGGAFCGGWFGITAMKFMTVRSGYSGFAFYSLGASLFSFLLYLTVA